MNWVIISIFLFFSSVVSYLFVRRVQLNKVPNIYINLAMFLIPTLVIFLSNIYLKLSFVLPLNLYILIFLTGIFLSYLGSLFSLTGIKQAPNPGYSLIISKSYVVMTSILAVFIFSAPLTITNIIAIALIVGFSALIVVEKNNSETKLYKKTWILYTLGAFFCWGFMALVSKYILDLGVHVTVYLFYLLLFASSAFLVQALIKREKHNFQRRDFSYLLIIGVCSSIFNLALQSGYLYAPNPGYINAVSAASISVLTLASAYFFKDELSIKKLIGVFGVLVGLFILFL